MAKHVGWKPGKTPEETSLQTEYCTRFLTVIVNFKSNSNDNKIEVFYRSRIYCLWVETRLCPAIRGENGRLSTSGTKYTSKIANPPGLMLKGAKKN